MKFQILPKATIQISTPKSQEHIMAALDKYYKNGKDKKISFRAAYPNFEIQRVLSWTRSSKVITRGKITSDAGRNVMVLNIHTEEPSLPFFLFIWYGFNTGLLILFIYFLMKNGHFSFAFLIPVIFIFVGYGFTTLTLESEIDRAVEEILKAIRLQ